MGKSQFDEPMTFAKWWAIRSSALLELKLTPAQWYEKFAGTNIDTGGTPQLMLDTSGRITEANSATISGNVANYVLGMRYDRNGLPLFSAGPAPGGTGHVNAQPIWFQDTLTATAGGEIVAADVGPATKASYKGCMLITHVYSDQTDAGIAFTIAPSAGGLTLGLGAMTIATVADTVTPDYRRGLAWKADTAAATIQFACAAGQAGNAQQVTFCGIKWWEV